jgi:hypothetical protein
MADPAAWRELGARFQELSSKEIYQGPLRASWRSVPFNDKGEHWLLSGDASDYVIEGFRLAAERAGVLLGSPAGPPALFHWLDLLRAEKRRYEGGGLSISIVGKVEIIAETGTIRAVCQASKDQCYKLETKAMAAQILSGPSAGAEPPLAQPVTGRQETIAQQIERLRVECDWKIEVLAEMAEISARTVQRHVSGVTTPSARLRGRYERVFSKHLKIKVVIKKLS